MTASAAIAKTVIYTGAHGGDFLSKPDKLKYSANETGTTQSAKLKDLQWKHWGDGKATSPTTATFCSDQRAASTQGRLGEGEEAGQPGLDRLLHEAGRLVRPEPDRVLAPTTYVQLPVLEKCW